jgi:hypothetical protein
MVFTRRFSLPLYLRRDHPLVALHLRYTAVRSLKTVVFGSSIGLFLAFGGLSLPMLYFLLSLIIVIQLSAGTAYTIRRAQTAGMWDLICTAPFSGRELLLSAWGAGLCQVRQSWMMPIYRLLHGLVIIAAVVTLIWTAELTPTPAFILVIGGTLLIALQPYADMYLSGMAGLLCASAIRDRAWAIMVAGLVTLLYWSGWVGAVLLVIVARPEKITAGQIAFGVSLPLLIPVCLGYLAQRIAEHLMQST